MMIDSLSRPSRRGARRRVPSRWPALFVAHVALLCSTLVAPLAAPLSAQARTVPDFDAAMRGLRFDLAGDWNDDGDPNGIVDADELALLAAILSRPTLDLSRTRGVRAASVIAAWDEALASATADLRALNAQWPTAATVAAGYAMLGPKSLDAYSAMSSGFNAPLKGRYDLARALAPLLAGDGDADGDGVNNRAEYAAQIGKGRAAYIAAALDPAVKVAGSVAAGPARSGVRTVGIVLYPGFEALDVFGPLEMWANMQELKVVLIAQNAGPVRSAQGFTVDAPFSFATAPKIDILMVPGGIGTRTELENPVFLDYIRAADRVSEITSSVCTGSALLAKAGLLRGRRATSNKAYFSLATDQDPGVNWIATARWVDDGKYFTSSGVSAGTDMALGLVARLFGKPRAQQLAYSLEYQWNDDPTNDPFTREPGKAVRP